MSSQPGPPTFDDYVFPGYAYPGEPRRPVTYQIPATLNRRVNGAVRWAGDTDTIPGLGSKVDLVRLSLHKFLTGLENQYLGGRPFPLPNSTRRGRGPERSGSWDKITVQLPESLIDRTTGAINFLTGSDVMPGITSTNKLVAYAIDLYVTSLENQYRRGRIFKDPRSRLVAGRPPVSESAPV